MIPTINVALTPRTWSPVHGARHEPILIHCPIPRSVTFSVALGKCDGRCATWCSTAPHGHDSRGVVHVHHDTCPARPIRVLCSISGKTWEESVVQEVDLDDVHPHVLTAAVNVCRARWVFVKALVLGHPDLSALVTGPKALDLLAQRDAVFAALADMARAELAHFNASTTLFSALKACDVERAHVSGPASYAMGWQDPSDADATLNSRAGLAAYVEMLSEKVGALP